MRRFLLLAAGLAVVLPAFGQAADPARVPSLPPDQVPITADLSVLTRGYAPADTLDEAQILRRLARVYQYQSDLLMAASEGDEQRTEDLLGLAMTNLASLVSQPGIMERPRFRELYRSVVTEYERFYGVADTLTLAYGDIYQARADVFAALDDVDEPLLEQAVLHGLQPLETQVPMTMNRLVERSITYLLRSPDKHLNHWLSRAETYFPMIEQIFAEEGVPDELKYLAMIESGLNPRAKSWAAAGGMWQFIRATGRAYGLEVDTYVDERMDPEKATRAAARHLKDLHAMFGDWHLALAGYNYSPGKLRRHVQRAEARLGRKATYWDVYDNLPRETRNYVPMFIAASLVASNPAAFDVAPVQPGPRYAYHYVPVQGMLSVSQVADLAGTTTDLIRALNPELRRSVLPPTREPYYVRIPLGHYDRFAEGYAALPPEARSGAAEYVVRRGDTLGKIAGQYGLSVRALMQNNGLRSTTIQIGQRLAVPVPSYEPATPLNLAEADVATVQYGPRLVRPIASNAAAAERRPATPVVAARTSTPAPAGPSADDAREAEQEDDASSQTRVVYQVRRGDSLGKIAARYGVTVSDIKGWNSLRGTTIRTGQRLHLYVDNDRQAAAEAKPVTYKVRRGDTLSEIAARHGVSTRALRSWNNLSSSTIRVGQRLTIHPSGTPASNKVTYRVQRGDSLYVIARKYGVSISDLKRWNNLRGSTIRPGQRLTVHV